MNDLTMTNVWLAILAIVSLVEFLMIAVAGLVAFKMYKQVTTVIETLERVHIAPLRARVDAVLDEVELIVGKVKRAQDTVSSTLHTAAGAGSLLADTVKARAWPILGVIRGARMAAAVLTGNGRDDKEVYGSSRP